MTASTGVPSQQGGDRDDRRRGGELHERPGAAPLNARRGDGATLPDTDRTEPWPGNAPYSTLPGRTAQEVAPEPLSRRRMSRRTAIVVLGAAGAGVVATVWGLGRGTPQQTASPGPSAVETSAPPQVEPYPGRTETLRSPNEVVQDWTARLEWALNHPNDHTDPQNPSSPTGSDILRNGVFKPLGGIGSGDFRNPAAPYYENMDGVFQNVVYGLSVQIANGSTPPGTRLRVVFEQVDSVLMTDVREGITNQDTFAARAGSFAIHAGIRVDFVTPTGQTGLFMGLPGENSGSFMDGTFGFWREPNGWVLGTYLRRFPGDTGYMPGYIANQLHTSTMF
jgi:hypothetical protein